VNKYTPKVGEVFEKYNTADLGWDKKGTAIFVTDNEVAVLDEDGMIDTFPLDGEFRGIQTKADVERQELLLILDSLSYDEEAVSAMQMAGFTIPKKIKRSELEGTIADVWAGSYTQRTIVVKAVIKLLGDLVEQDGIGGAE
jgi:hypothetical protein